MNTLTSEKKIRLLALLAVLMVASLACVRSVAPEAAGVSEEAAEETKDAQVQMTLSALLASATGEVAATATPTVEATATEEATPTQGSVQLTELAAALTNEASTPSATPTPQFGGEMTETSTPAVAAAQVTSTACYEHRYVYDETYPDGTRVDPGEHFQKTWRLQNVGTCDWPAGDYALSFVEGSRMSGSDPLTITYSVPSGGYANFSINLVAPSVPGTYRGYWILETDDGELIGWGPNQDQSFWVEIQVRGSTPTP